MTLVDRHVYNMFQPLMYQVATGGLNAGDVTYFLRSLRAKQSNADFRHGLLTGIDTEHRIAEMSDGEHLHYDWLILANGVNTSYFGTPGAYEYAYSMYSRSQALRIRDELFTRLEQAAAQQGPDEIRVVIVGGGATGVEMAGALAELRDQRSSAPTRRSSAATSPSRWCTAAASCSSRSPRASVGTRPRSSGSEGSCSAWTRASPRSRRTGSSPPRASSSPRRRSSGPPGSRRTRRSPAGACRRPTAVASR